MEVFFKEDYTQVTGSFKERGARNTLLSLSAEQKKIGVVAASAGEIYTLLISIFVSF